MPGWFFIALTFGFVCDDYSVFFPEISPIHKSLMVLIFPAFGRLSLLSWQEWLF